jgi:hypothetical protein
VQAAWLDGFRISGDHKYRLTEAEERDAIKNVHREKSPTPWQAGASLRSWMPKACSLYDLFLQTIRTLYHLGLEGRKECYQLSTMPTIR